MNLNTVVDRELRDRLLSEYGDGWYDGFIAAKEICESENLHDDLLEYHEDVILEMSEYAEQIRGESN